MYFKDHWAYNKMLDTFKLMLDSNKTDFVCGLPYELSIQEGLMFAEDVEGEMLESDFNEIRWSMEMEALWYGDEGGSFFDFNSISKNRRIQYPMRRCWETAQKSRSRQNRTEKNGSCLRILR